MFAPNDVPKVRSQSCAVDHHHQRGKPMRHQLKKRAANRLLTSIQPSWRGPPAIYATSWQDPLPAAVDAILARDALAEPYRDFFAKWANNLALLSSMFVQRSYQSEAARISNQFANNPWHRYNVYDLAQCDVGAHSLWIKKQVVGWSVELRYPCDIDARVLSTAEMPILCPDEVSAMKLALACYPNAVADLAWHSYW
jgi:hypothetical protein